MTAGTTELAHRAMSELEQRGVRVVFGTRVGSKTFGIESPTSDDDMFFWYVYPEDRYFTVGDNKPSDSFAGKLDGNDWHAWELGKALNLFVKSNARTLEQLHSPYCFEDTLGQTDLIRWYDHNPRALWEQYAGHGRGYMHALMETGTAELGSYGHHHKELKLFLHAVRCAVLARTMPHGNYDHAGMRLEDLLERVDWPGEIKFKVMQLIIARRHGKKFQFRSGWMKFVSDQMAVSTMPEVARHKYTFPEESMKELSRIYRVAVSSDWA